MPPFFYIKNFLTTLRIYDIIYIERKKGGVVMFTLEHVKDLLNQVAEQMNYPCPDVKINNRFKTRTLARAHWEDGKEWIELNKRVLSFEVYDLLDVLRHEFYHIMLKASDDDPEFQMACRLSGIPLNGDKKRWKSTLPPESPYKYELYCSACNVVFKRYRRLAGYAKKVAEAPDRYGCKVCGDDGSAKVRACE